MNMVFYTHGGREREVQLCIHTHPNLHPGVYIHPPTRTCKFLELFSVTSAKKAVLAIIKKIETGGF